MATLGLTGKVTLLDIAQAMDPNGKIADVAELLTKLNEMLMDMPWREGNLPTGHKATIRTGLPTSVWRSFYQGVPPSKSQRAQITDACAMMEARSEVDSDEANLNGNAAAFRLSEAAAFVESMNQTMMSSVIYGNMSTNPEQFNGLAPRYSSLSATNAQNILSAGGSGSDNTSIWMVNWGDGVHGIYPKGSRAGLDHQDLGEIDAFDSNQNRFRAFADIWKWKCGLHVKDWRNVVRIANVDISDLQGLTGTQAVTATTHILKLMTRATQRIPYLASGTPVFYANRTVKEMLAVHAQDKSNNVLSIQDGTKQFGDIKVGGQELRFLGIPVRTVDALLNTETAVS